ncbi:MAG: D-aminoacyl-tRNA deacylase [Thermodesulfobacteriota bacterium]
MRAVVQRARQASVSVAGTVVGSIAGGMVVLLGVGQEDTERDAAFLAEKLCNLRIFDDENGVMNLPLIETGGEMLVVSQFTLFGDCRKGRRPSYASAAPPTEANRLYEHFIGEVRARGIAVATGTFQAMMEVALINDGPVTLLVDSKKLF